MAADSIVRFEPGRSPFDVNRRVRDDGTGYWLGREMQGPMGYVRWENMLRAIKRARSTCLANGHQPTDHFRDITKMVDIGSGAQRPQADFEISRYGCYLLALSGDTDKPETAAAKEYFAKMARVAETGMAVPEAMVPTAKPWSVRFRETTADHFCYMTTHHPGYFSTVSASVVYMLMMEEELARHLLPLKPGDLPDGSIGQRWAHYRRDQGLPPATLRAPLLMPDRGIKAQVLIYSVAELGDFLNWLNAEYIPKHLPDYYGNKPEFRPCGELPPASAADHTSRRLTGRSAHLEPRVRRQLAAAGGFFPVGATLPALEGAQRTLFDMSG